MVILHTLFLVSVAAEYLINYSSRNAVQINILLLFLFIVLQVFRFYTIYSLGKYWTTKILRIPGTPLVKRGIYKFAKHPNYIIVVIEIALIPLIFNCYYTAVVFSILNLLMLVASTDLSHFYDQQTAKALDAEMLHCIASFQPESLFEAEHTGKGFACGHAATAAVLWAAREQGGNTVKILHHATSGDVTGDYGQVVGYGAAVVLRPTTEK